MKDILKHILKDNSLHAKWLNTLSYLENCGAKKIAKAEPKTKVKEEMLKHAAEEFRHAHYLKRQIKKLPCVSMSDYSVEWLLGGVRSLHYLHALDIKTCRFLKYQAKLSRQKIQELAYLLVTYGIELRADQLYKTYDEMLKANCSKVSVKSILLEEKEHLQEMQRELEQIENGLLYAQQVCAIEAQLYTAWLEALTSDIHKDTQDSSDKQ